MLVRDKNNHTRAPTGGTGGRAPAGAPAGCHPRVRREKKRYKIYMEKPFDIKERNYRECYE